MGNSANVVPADGWMYNQNMSKKHKKPNANSSKKPYHNNQKRPTNKVEVLILTISGMTLLGSIIWFIYSPGFEPLLVILGEVGGIVAIRKRFVENNNRSTLIIGTISVIVFGLGLYLVFLSNNKLAERNNESSIQVENFEQIFNNTYVEQSYYEYPGDKDSNIRSILDEGDKAFDGQRYSVALKYYEIARDKAIELSDEEGKAISFINIGITYIELDDTNQAFENLDQAYVIAKDNDLPDLAASAKKEIGSIYYNSEDYFMALLDFQASEEILKETSNTKLLAEVTRWISYTYGNMYEKNGEGGDELANKLEYELRSIGYYGQLNDSYMVGVMQYYTGETYQQMRELDKALEYYVKSSENDAPINIFRFLSYIKIGDVNYELGNTSEAFKFYRLAAIQLENPSVSMTPGIRADWYAKLNEAINKLSSLPEVHTTISQTNSAELGISSSSDTIPVTAKTFQLEGGSEFTILYESGKILRVFPESP